MDRRRMRWIAIACVTAIVAGALVSGANAWAAKGDERCRRVPAPGPSAENPNGHGSMRAWRGAALRAVGCGAWREMRQHMPHRHGHR